MQNRRLTTLCVAAFASLSLYAQPAAAQSRDKVQDNLNNSNLCPSIGLQRDVTIIFAKVSIGIDRNHHTIKKFEKSGDKIRIEGEVACQPSDEGLLIKMGIPVASFRIADNFGCDATISGSTVTGVSCTISGAIGSLIAAKIDFNNYVKAALQGAL